MDISRFLNPSEKPGLEAEAMKVDSPTTSSWTSSTHHSSRESSATVESTDLSSPHHSRPYPYRLQPMDGKSQPKQASSEITLPPLRIFLQTIGPTSLHENENLDYCTQMSMLAVQNNGYLHSHPQIHHSRSTDGIVRTFNSFQPSLLRDQDTRTHLPRRRSHHSSSCSSHSPRAPHHRIFRRGSHPQTYYPASLRHDAHKHRPHTAGSSPSKPKPSSAHNNKPYKREMVDWIRYHKVDRSMSFKQDCLPLFFEQFPERYDPNATEQTLSSRVYRDNNVPLLDADGNWSIDEKGNLRVRMAKVRDRATVEGKELDIPATMVDKWPHRLVTYTHWKSAVLREDMERAREIMKGNDPGDVNGKRENWRRKLREVEHLLYKAEDSQ